MLIYLGVILCVLAIAGIIWFCEHQTKSPKTLKLSISTKDLEQYIEAERQAQSE